jgi:hypothetical protein
MTGGIFNAASGDNTSVSGGSRVISASSYEPTTDGSGNIIGSLYSSVSGGAENAAIGSFSSVSGGAGNTANGSYTYDTNTSRFDLWDGDGLTWIGGMTFSTAPAIRK